MEPIWRDYYLTLTPAAGGVPFSIVDRNSGNAVIFRGRAWQKPEGGSIKVRLNDIAAGAFDRHFYPADLVADKVTARLGIEDEGGDILGTVDFYQDWSYDVQRAEAFSPSDWLNEPIGDTFAPGQYIPVTNLGTGFRTVMVYTEDEVVEETAQAGATTFIDTTLYPTAYALRLGYGYCARVCARWVLYYVNAYGGWDWMVVRGNVAEGDTVTRYNADRIYDNSDPYKVPRGRVNYASEIVHTYTIGTGALDEVAVGRMHHLLNATDVYLHDLERGTLVPLVITNGAAQYRRNGKMAQYEITAQLAQQRRR